MKKWYVTFNENGYEYTGSLDITAEACVQTGPKIVVADGVIIEIDEDIQSVEEEEQ